MHEMIRRQAVAARATHRATRETLAAEPVPAPSGPVRLVGLGTSFHAALAAAATLTGPGGPGDVRAIPSFDLLEAASVGGPETTAVVFSESGETALTVAAQQRLRDARVRTILISAHSGTRSAALADRTIVTEYADETSWTHTVSFTAALVAFGALVEHWRGTATTEAVDEDEVAEAMTGALALETKVVDLVDVFADRNQFLFVGSGAAEATAREAALKHREGAGRFCASVGVEELLHGVLPSVGTTTAVLAIAGTPLERERALQGLNAARLVGAKTLLVDSSGGAGGDGILSVPSVARPPAPALQIVPFQLLTYWTAVAEGRNPDIMGLDEPDRMRARSSFGI